MKTGKVMLVGAGPGDPELLTQKGLRCIQTADVIVYDALACPSMLNAARPDCELIFAGKQAGHHFKKQRETNLLLAELAEQGKQVVRLKGGDPFIFGRGGEEAQVLRERGIPFEIVPGVSSCYSAPAYAGIPVTHRSYASAFHVITGHKKMDSRLDLDYATLAKLDGTLIFLMSLMNLPHIAANLMANGKSGDTPAAVIQQGTTSKQKTVSATLANIAEAVRRQNIHTPAMTVIGEVAALREELQWFEKGALFGKKAVVTGTPAHAAKTAELLRQHGAETAQISLIRTTEPDSDVLGEIAWNSYTWLVLTSANGVRLFFENLAKREIDVRQLMHLKFAAIGTGTAEALAERGIFVDCVPERFESRYLAQALIPLLGEQDRVLLLRAENGSPVLPQLLAEAGKAFDAVSLYRTEPDLRKKTLLDMALVDADYLLFSSSSAVQAYAQLRGEQAGDCPAKVVAIGAVTASTAEAFGIPVAYTAAQADPAGMLACLLQDVGTERKE